MIIFIRKCHLKQLEKIMSAFLDSFNEALAKVAAGNADDEAVKAAVAEIQERLDANEASDQELKDALMALVNKLAEAPAA